MRSLFVTALTLFSLAGSASAAALVVPPPGVPPIEVLDRYVNATEAQGPRDLTMEVEIDAKLPRLNKQGTLTALRRVTQLGEITYNGVRYIGDKMIKKDVIARYLSAETQAANGKVAGNEKESGAGIAIIPANYKFKYKGMADSEGRWAYVFDVSPRKKKVGLFKGEIWVDASTFLPVREAGRLVKTPSIFLKKVEFVRNYEIRNGVAVPTKIESRIYTRIVGQAELSIHFTNVSVQGEKMQAMVCPMGW